MDDLINYALLIHITILWAHLFTAVFFIGGSFFFWIVILPASHLFTSEESARTLMVGKIAKAFGRTVKSTLMILIATGIYNASWYVSSIVNLLTYPGTLLLTKTILVGLLIILVYVHNVYFGKKIVAAAKERKVDDLVIIGKKSRIISAANLLLMAVILFLAVLMQTPI